MKQPHNSPSDRLIHIGLFSLGFTIGFILIIVSLVGTAYLTGLIKTYPS